MLYTRHVCTQVPAHSPPQAEWDNWLDLVRQFLTPVGVHVLDILQNQLMVFGDEAVEVNCHVPLLQPVKQAILAMKRLELFMLGCRGAWALKVWRERRVDPMKPMWKAWLRADLNQRELNWSEKNVVWQGRYCMWLTRYCTHLCQQFPHMDVLAMHGSTDDDLEDMYVDIALGIWADSVGVQQTDALEVEQRKAEMDAYTSVDDLLPPFHQAHNGQWVEYMNNHDIVWNVLTECYRKLMAFAQVSCAGGAERLVSHLGLMTAISDYMAALSWTVVRYFGQGYSHEWEALCWNDRLMTDLRLQVRMANTAACHMSLLVHRLMQMMYNRDVVGVSKKILLQNVMGEHYDQHHAYNRPMHPSVIGGWVALDTFQMSRSQAEKYWFPYIQMHYRQQLFNNLSDLHKGDSTWNVEVLTAPDTQVYVFDCPMMHWSRVNSYDSVVYAWPIQFQMTSRHVNVDPTLTPWLYPHGTNAIAFHVLSHNVLMGSHWTMVGDACGLQRTHNQWHRPLLMNVVSSAVWKLMVQIGNAYYHPGFYHLHHGAPGVVDRSYSDLAFNYRRLGIFLQAFIEWPREHYLWMVWLQMVLVMRTSAKQAFKQFNVPVWWNLRFIKLNAMDCHMQHILSMEYLLLHRPPSMHFQMTSSLLEAIHHMHKHFFKVPVFTHELLSTEARQLWDLFKSVREQYRTVWQRDLELAHSPSLGPQAHHP